MSLCAAKAMSQLVDEGHKDSTPKDSYTKITQNRCYVVLIHMFSNEERP